jgi:5'-methylthioadenosine phosphorylase
MSALGIIGGSGLADSKFFECPEELTVETPYGATSSTLHCGRLKGQEVVLLSRHGRQHTIPPSQVNNRANLWALQHLGCDRVLTTAACGSLRAEIGRGAIVVPDQFIDFTRQRPVTFHESFPPGIENAKHAPMADPFKGDLRRHLLAAGQSLGLDVRDGGTILTIEGPRFSTRAESRMFRAWGADLVNMTIAPEAALANELGLAYAVVALVTDFDSWKEDEPPLLVQDLVNIFRANVEHVTALLLATVPRLTKGGGE